MYALNRQLRSEEIRTTNDSCGSIADDRPQSLTVRNQSETVAPCELAGPLARTRPLSASPPRIAQRAYRGSVIVLPDETTVNTFVTIPPLDGSSGQAARLSCDPSRSGSCSPSRFARRGEFSARMRFA